MSALAEVLTRTEDGLVVVDADRRYVYANPAACQVLGYPVEQLRGRDFLASFRAREHATVLDHLPQQLGDTAAPFTCIMRGPDGVEREMCEVDIGWYCCICSTEQKYREPQRQLSRLVPCSGESRAGGSFAAPLSVWG